ncbi:claudin-10-like [Brienomyrus brachyistius]|uniref:claudin-10-like n=1 Tax=Brienomyrus brachyistius TaxID=42636 RepID=UPI0020B32B04|nr:claudin-10-like [Brienomyrus brachyistius]
MNSRVMQIFGFLFNVLGWIFVACTLAMEFWKISSIGGQGGSSVMKVAWYWASLWKSCYTDSTAITNCIDFPVFWSVEDHIQVVRGLLMGGLSMGILAFMLSFMGMECTYIGGQEQQKKRILFSGGFFHIISGMLSFTGYVFYANQVFVEYFNPLFKGLKFDLGTPLFLGWVGSALEITGGTFHCISILKLLCQKSQPKTTTDLIPEESEIEDLKLNEKSSSKSELSFKSKTSLKSEISFKSEASSSKAKVALVSDFTTMSQLNPDSELSCVPQLSDPMRASGAVNQQNKKSYV